MSHSHTEHGHRSANEHVQRITDAEESRSADMHTRTVKYTISMTVRLVCFIAAFFTHGPVQWVLLVCAVILPYFAVVVANAGGHKTERHPSTAFYDPLADAAGAGPHLPGGSARGDDGEGDGSAHGDDGEDDGAARRETNGTGARGETNDGGVSRSGHGGAAPRSGHDARDGRQQDDEDEPLIVEGELYVPGDPAADPEDPPRVPGNPPPSKTGQP